MIDRYGDQDSVGIFFDIEANRFIDEDGFFIWNIHEIVKPSDILIFKMHGEYMLVPHATIPGLMVEMYHPDDDWDRWDEACPYFVEPSESPHTNDYCGVTGERCVYYQYGEIHRCIFYKELQNSHRLR